MENDKPTELSIKDIDNFVESLMNSEIKPKTCLTCSKEFYLDSYGWMFGECDECYFKRWPEEDKKAFFRKFFE